MGHTLTWVRRAGALRTDPLDGPFLFEPKPVAGEEYYSIPVGSFLKTMPGPIDYSAPPVPGTVEMQAGPGFHVIFTPEPPVYPPYPDDEFSDSPFHFPGNEPEPEPAPRGGSREYEELDEVGYRERGSASWIDDENGRPTGKARVVIEKQKKAAETKHRQKEQEKEAREHTARVRADILKRARGGPDQRMKDWRKAANERLADMHWEPVTQEESQREQKRRRNQKAHSRKKDRGLDRADAFRGKEGLLPSGIQIVGGPRMDVLANGKMGPMTIVANDHLQRAVQSSMRGSLLN
jgi:hypothetical protein